MIPCPVLPEEISTQLRDLLAISDPTPPTGETPSPYCVSQLYWLLDERYCFMWPTSLTVNADAEGDLDGLLSVPIIDRLQQDAEIIPCFWPSHRERKRKK
jgi:hypothetical protein